MLIASPTMHGVSHCHKLQQQITLALPAGYVPGATFKGTKAKREQKMDSRIADVLGWTVSRGLWNGEKHRILHSRAREILTGLWPDEIIMLFELSHGICS